MKNRVEGRWLGAGEEEVVQKQRSLRVATMACGQRQSARWVRSTFVAWRNLWMERFRDARHEHLLDHTSLSLVVQYQRRNLRRMFSAWMQLCQKSLNRVQLSSVVTYSWQRRQLLRIFGAWRMVRVAFTFVVCPATHMRIFLLTTVHFLSVRFDFVVCLRCTLERVGDAI